jgi:anti-sigma B factor antagonist
MSATVFEKNGTVLTVKPEGRLDTAAVTELDAELKQQLDGVQDIIFDFSNVNYITSIGLRMLLGLAQRAEEKKGSLRLIHVGETIIEVFEMVGFMELMQVERD